MQITKINENENFKIKQQIDNHLEAYQEFVIEDFIWLNDAKFSTKLNQLIELALSIEYYEACNKLNKIKNVFELFLKEINYVQLY